MDKVRRLGMLSGLGVWLILVIHLETATAASGLSYRIYFAAEAEQNVPIYKPVTEFDCNQKVYGILETNGLPKRKHRLEVLWIDPNGKQREHTKYDFYITMKKETIWVWLKLHRPTDAMLDRMLLMNRASGMENFIGKWSVKFYVDGKFIEKKSFKVFC